MTGRGALLIVARVLVAIIGVPILLALALAIIALAVVPAGFMAAMWLNEAIAEKWRRDRANMRAMSRRGSI